MNTRDQNSSEQVIVLIPTVIVANTIYEVFRGMVQSYLTSVWDNLELWKDVQTQIPTFAWVLDWKVLLLSHSKVDSSIRFFPHRRPGNPDISTSYNTCVLHYPSLRTNLNKL
jgi:hypothetical protein